MSINFSPIFPISMAAWNVWINSEIYRFVSNFITEIQIAIIPHFSKEILKTNIFCFVQFECSLTVCLEILNMKRPNNNRRWKKYIIIWLDEKETFFFFFSSTEWRIMQKRMRGKFIDARSTNIQTEGYSHSFFASLTSSGTVLFVRSKLFDFFFSFPFLSFSR